MKSVLLMMIAATILRAGESTPSYRMSLIGEDSRGNRHTIILGLDSAASYGFDEGLGEAPVPPSPPAGIFDFRFTDIPGRGRIPYTGCYVDIRPAVSAAQRDTFIVHCQASVYPMSVTLQSRSGAWIDSIIVERLPLGLTRASDLIREKTFSVASEEESTARIIVYSRRRTETRR